MGTHFEILLALGFMQVFFPDLLNHRVPGYLCIFEGVPNGFEGTTDQLKKRPEFHYFSLKILGLIAYTYSELRDMDLPDYMCLFTPKIVSRLHQERPRGSLYNLEMTLASISTQRLSICDRTDIRTYIEEQRDNLSNSLRLVRLSPEKTIQLGNGSNPLCIKPPQAEEQPLEKIPKLGLGCKMM